MSYSQDLEKLQIVGYKCSLFSEPAKNLEINQGALLVPWGNNKSLLIDRFDCRGYLLDVSEYDADNIERNPPSQTVEDKALEEMCNDERYRELRSDIHDGAILQEQETKPKEEVSNHSYGAVNFSYDVPSQEGQLAEVNPECTMTGAPSVSQIGPDSDTNNKDAANGESDDIPYLCPPDLILPPEVAVPEFERQAERIERTALFIARHNTQMEIVVKTRQAGNPQFNFLNYDNKYNPFYKEIVRLIKRGRYIPRLRPIAETNSNSDVSDDYALNGEDYELKLPKVDISDTAYASLINRFKKAASEKLGGSSRPDAPSPRGSPASPAVSASEVTTEGSAVAYQPAQLPVADTAALEAPVLTDAALEQCYQDYYRHYYSHYYVQLTSTGSGGDEQLLITEAARLAATAASAAVNAMRQSNFAMQAANASMPSSDVRGIIDKMAEYVARNGDEFQEVVKKQKQDDSRFAFLETGHIFHEYYVQKKHEIAATLHNGGANGKDGIQCYSYLEGTSSPMAHEGDDTSKSHPLKSISFRLTKSASSGRLKDLMPSPTTTTSEPEAVAAAETLQSGANLRGSKSCSVLPGISYYSDSDESDVSPPPSQVDDSETMTRTLSAVLEVPTAECPVTRIRSVSPAPSTPKQHTPPTPSLAAPSSPFAPVVSCACTAPPPPPTHSPENSNPTSIPFNLTQRDIARDIRAMEEEARLQLERRKRAALFAARIQQARLNAESEQLDQKQVTSEPTQLRHISVASTSMAHSAVAMQKIRLHTERRDSSRSPSDGHRRRRRRTKNSNGPSDSEDEEFDERKKRRRYSGSGGGDSRRHHHRRHRRSPKHRNHHSGDNIRTHSPPPHNPLLPS